MKRKSKKKVYEQTAPEIQELWMQMFRTPSTSIDGIDVSDIIPRGFLERVKLILKTENNFKQQNKAELCSMNRDEFFADIDEPSADDIQCRSTALSIKGVQLDNQNANAYRNFFKRPQYKATIWEENKILTKEQMTLNQQAKAVAESIAKEFIDWIATIGGIEESTINVDRIVKMFDIVTKTEYTASCKVNPKRVPCLKKTRPMPKEIDFSLGTQKVSKFPAKLNQEMKFCKNRYTALDSMETVWKEITHLKSTGDFLIYLSTNYPDVEQPKYILRKNTLM